MDLDRIERLVRLFGRSHARELQVEREGWSLSLSRANAPVAAGAAPPRETPVAAGADEPGQDTTRVTITAPLVGIFRQGGVRLQPGDRVEAGAPLGSIESMKILSPVWPPRAERSKRSWSRTVSRSNMAISFSCCSR
jgi:biotin carboxyl carrier protein